MTIQAFIFTLSIFTLTSLTASAQSIDPQQVPNFKVVSPGKVYRSAQPTMEGIHELAHMGIKTIINLRNERMQLIEMEAGTAKLANINHISIPLASWGTPKDADITRAIQILRNPHNYPILVHCKHGEDRTGLVIALHRIFNENVDPEAAELEMKANGFHNSLYKLKLYFSRLTHSQSRMNDIRQKLFVN